MNRQEPGTAALHGPADAPADDATDAPGLPTARAGAHDRRGPAHPVLIADPPLLNVHGVHQPYTPARRRDRHRGRRHRHRRDLRRHQVPGHRPPLRRTAARPLPVRPQRHRRPRPAGRHRRHPGGERRRRRRAARRTDRRQTPAVGLLRLRSGLPGRPGQGPRPARARAARRQGTGHRRVQRLPLLPLGRTPGRRRGARHLGRGGRPRGHRRAGQALRRRPRLHLLQAQGRRLPAGPGDRRRTGPGRSVPRPPAASRPQRRLDTGDLAEGRRRAHAAYWSTWRTRPPEHRTWPRSPPGPTCRSPPTCA